MKFKITSMVKGKNESKEMIKRSADARAWLNRVAYRIYQNWQRERWMSEGSSQGSKWPRLNPEYARYKLKRYGGGPKYKWVGGRGENRPWQPAGRWPKFPGGGTKMMIATGTLVDSVTGKSLKYHRKIVTPKELFISTTVPYANDANERRNFTEFKDTNIAYLGELYTEYVMKGTMRQ